MEGLVQLGLVRAIGFSNFNVQQIKELLKFAKIVPAVNQVELHPFWRQDELVKVYKSRGIHVYAHTPLGVPASSSGSESRSSGSEDEPGTPRISFRRSRSFHDPVLKLSVVAEIADKHKKTPKQEDVEALQLQYLSEHGVVLNDDEAYKQVQGHRSGYIRGRGAGPKPVSISARALQKKKNDERDKQLDEARREADEARREADGANKKVECLRGQFDQFRKDMEMMKNLMMPNC